jgi:undecaprenyl-diphosphatase
MPDGIQRIDESILFFIQRNLKSPALDRIMVFTTSLGNAGLFWIAAAFLLLLQKRYQKCGASLILTIPLARILGDNILKPFVGRARPCNKFAEIRCSFMLRILPRFLPATR